MKSLVEEENFIGIFVENLRLYCCVVRDSDIPAGTDGGKAFPLSKEHSHAEEIECRLAFLRFVAEQSSFKFKKEELRVIYDSLAVQSPFAADDNEFLHWCQKCCLCGVLDIQEIADYQSEIMKTQKLSFASVGPEGFKFFRFIILAKNQELGKINVLKQKQTKGTQQVTAGTTWTSYYVTTAPHMEVAEDDDDTDDT
jgi:hypothetical protein